MDEYLGDFDRRLQHAVDLGLDRASLDQSPTAVAADVFARAERQHASSGPVAAVAAMCLFLTVAAAVVAGRSLLALPPAASSSPVTPSIAEGSWLLQEAVVDGDVLTLQSNSRITLTLNGTAISGTAACNEYTANVIVSDRTIQIPPPGRTKRACGFAAGVLELEAAYLASLPRISGFSIVDGHLILVGEGVRLRYASLEAPTLDKIIGRLWVLDQLLDGAGAVEPSEADLTLKLNADGRLHALTGAREITAEFVVRGTDLVSVGLTVVGDDPAPALADQDSHIVGVIEAFTATVDGDRLTLRSSRGMGLIYSALD